MERLALTDAGWLLVEGRERPMHVGGLLLFSPPEGAPRTFVRDLVEAVRRHDGARPPFSYRLARPYGRAGLFGWVDDEVELDYHLRHIALPEPGRIRELLAFVSQVHGSLLDRHRPLWETYLIEGVEGGRFALYAKVHHSMLDGVAAMRQLTRSLTTDEDERDAPPPWALRPEQATSDARGAGGPSGPLGLAARVVGGALDQATSVLGSVLALTEQAVRSRSDAAEVMPYRAPRSMLNVPLTSTRRYVAQSYELDRIRSVASAAGATVNDVVLTMCGAALRRYLLDHDALPAAPLVAMVPVSIRPADAGDRGNALTMLLANLATHVAEPVRRLALVKESMDLGKRRLEGMTQTQLVDYALLLMGPLMAGQVLGVSRRTRPLFNVLISNVPGPTDRLFWNGARLSGMYPLSLLPDGYALNITQTSYAGSMEVGITADRRALPGIQRLIDHLEDALAELEDTASSGRRLARARRRPPQAP